MAGKLVLLSNWRWILVALKKSNFPVFVLSPVTVNACFLQSNQVRDNIHLWQFACTWEVCVTVCLMLLARLLLLSDGMFILLHFR